MMRILAEPREGASSIIVTRAEGSIPVQLKPVSFLLTLTHDPKETFAQGRISLLQAEGSYRIRGSLDLFELLYSWLATDGVAEDDG